MVAAHDYGDDAGSNCKDWELLGSFACRRGALDEESEAAKDTSTASAWAQIVEATKGPDFGNVASSASSSSTIS